MNRQFLAILHEAHQLRLKQPRNPIARTLGRELATQALECKRVAEIGDWLWQVQTQNANSTAERQTSALEAQAVARLAIALSQTWLGRRLVRSRVLRSIGKLAMRQLGRSPKT
jgi:hypothetical protein